MKDDLKSISKLTAYRLLKSLPLFIVLAVTQLVVSCLMVAFAKQGTIATTARLSTAFVVALLFGIMFFIIYFNKYNVLHLNSIYCNGKLMAITNLIMLAIISLLITVVNMLAMPTLKFFEALFSSNLIAEEHFVATAKEVFLEGAVLFFALLFVGGLEQLFAKLFGKQVIIFFILVAVLASVIIMFGNYILPYEVIIYFAEHLWVLILVELGLSILTVGSNFAIEYFKEKK